MQCPYVRDVSFQVHTRAGRFRVLLWAWRNVLCLFKYTCVHIACLRAHIHLFTNMLLYLFYAFMSVMCVRIYVYATRVHVSNHAYDHSACIHFYKRAWFLLSVMCICAVSEWWRILLMQIRVVLACAPMKARKCVFTSVSVCECRRVWFLGVSQLEIARRITRQPRPLPVRCNIDATFLGASNELPQESSCVLFGNQNAFE